MHSKRTFEIQESTINFFYMVDSYWKKHHFEKSNKITKKLKPLFGGINKIITAPLVEMFLHRNMEGMISYKLFKRAITKDEFRETLTRTSFYKDTYNMIANHCFNYLLKDDIITICKDCKGEKYPLENDTYNLCL